MGQDHWQVTPNKQNFHYSSHELGIKELLHFTLGGGCQAVAYLLIAEEKNGKLCYGKALNFVRNVSLRARYE